MTRVYYEPLTKSDFFQVYKEIHKDGIYCITDICSDLKGQIGYRSNRSISHNYTMYWNIGRTKKDQS